MCYVLDLYRKYVIGKAMASTHVLSSSYVLIKIIIDALGPVLRCHLFGVPQ